MCSKQKDIEREATINQNKSELEQVVSAGVHGEPELKKGEKRRYLGEFKERVIKSLTFEQIAEPGVYPEILGAIKNSEAEKLIIHRKANLEAAKKYIELARENELSFKKVDSPEFKGDIGLVVVSGHAVNSDQIKVIDKEKKFKELGLPIELLESIGDKICKDCYEKIAEKAPEELINFKKIDWWEGLFNNSCACKH